VEGTGDVPQDETDEQGRERHRDQGHQHRHQDRRPPAGGGGPLGDGDHRQGGDEDTDQQGEVSLYRHLHVQLPARTDSYGGAG
jgi:hypothetical protein